MADPLLPPGAAEALSPGENEGARDNAGNGDPQILTALRGGQPPVPDVLSILPVRRSVLFPGMVVPMPISRPASRQLVDESLSSSKVLGVFTQKDPEQEEPGPLDLHRVGV